MISSVRGRDEGRGEEKREREREEREREREIIKTASIYHKTRLTF